MTTASLIWSDIPLHVIDFEGSVQTGVVEYGVVTLHRGEMISSATRLHLPRTDIPALDTQCHGLRAQDLAGLTPFESEWDYWVSLRRSGLLVAHNANVEERFLRGTWSRPSAVPSFVDATATLAEWGPWIDSCRLARAWMPSLGDYKLSSLISLLKLGSKLDDLAAVHCPPQRRRFHCALYDALASALLLRALCAREGRSHLPLVQMVRDSLSAPQADDLMQGELGL